MSAEYYVLPARDKGFFENEDGRGGLTRTQSASHCTLARDCAPLIAHLHIIACGDHLGRKA